MKRETLAVIFMTALCPIVWAQVPLTRPLNEARSGDHLNKVQVDYVQPDEGGIDQVWRLGQETRQSKDFHQGVASNGDTIALFEPDRIVHYVVHGDTLWDKGEQQRRTYRICQEERPVLHYPFAFGDSISGQFLASGMDEGIDLTVSGWGYTVADGIGLLTDGTDTLSHILRLHLWDDYTEDYGGQAQLHYLRDKYLWYMAGYRYPVQESLHWSLVEGDSAVTPIDSVTYLFLPTQQMELAEDQANDSIRQIVSLWDVQSGDQSGVITAMKELHASLSPDGMTLTLDFTLSDGASTISFIACDVMGNILGRATIDNPTEGNHHESISLSRKPIGNALMLNIMSGNEKQTEKVYQ